MDDGPELEATVLAALRGEVDELAEQYEALDAQRTEVGARLSRCRRAIALITGEPAQEPRAPRGPYRKKRDRTPGEPKPLVSEQVAERVLEVVRHQPEPALWKVIAADVALADLKPSTVANALSHLRARGRVKWAGKVGAAQLWAASEP